MAKFVYRMQNILNIKLKLESQAKIAFGLADQKYREEEQKLQKLFLRRTGYDKQLREAVQGTVNIQNVATAKRAVESMKELIQNQMRQVRKAELEREDARRALNAVTQDRKTHEKLREKAFEAFKKELLAEEGKAIDELVSYTYNGK